MRATLPPAFNFKHASDLIRVGRDNDGGYVVCENDIIQSSTLISLGINDDWSFEKEFKKRNNVPIHAYDASISTRVFLKRLVKNLWKIHRQSNLIYYAKTIASYCHFFSQNSNHHIKKFVGLNCDSEEFCTLDDIFKDLIEQKDVFLKIDIEGSEYRLLDSLIENQSRISGLAIEFHDVDLHLAKIIDFIKRFNLDIVHIHINNNGQIEASTKLPLVIEITFSANCTKYVSLSLPHALDMPNSPDIPEIILSIDT